jgi:glyoxylate/hydroxypyruvate reductase
MCGKPLAKSTIGIVGLGHIGLAIARRLQPFSIQRVLYSGRQEKQFDSEEDKQFFKFVSFEELLRQSDYVIIACALNDKTRNMFNKQAFELMKNDAILINIARGGIVDQDALYDALKNGQIQAAGTKSIFIRIKKKDASLSIGLDVTVPEPLPTDHRLLTLDNCTIFPHIGSADMASRHQMAQLCVDNLINFFSGKPMVRELKLDDI